jgi:hypothetical protein
MVRNRNLEIESERPGFLDLIYWVAGGGNHPGNGVPMHPLHQVTNRLSCDVDPIDHFDQGFLLRRERLLQRGNIFRCSSFQLAELAPEIPVPGPASKYLI